VDLYRTSYRLNSECKQAIHEAIADNYDGMYLGDGAVDQVVRQYGMERVGYMRGILNQNEFDEELVHELIKRIYVGMDNSVEVEFKCSDPYQEVLAIMSEVQNE